MRVVNNECTVNVQPVPVYLPVKFLAAVLALSDKISPEITLKTLFYIQQGHFSKANKPLKVDENSEKPLLKPLYTNS
jgi:hypothetical protein